MVIGGLLLVAAGLVAAAQASSLWQVYLGYGLGVGVGVGLSYVPSIAAVQRWFVRRRGTASGIAVAGIGVGTLIGAPLAHELIADLGWRQTYLVLAALTVVGRASSRARWCARRPSTTASRPDGDPPHPSGVSAMPAGLQPGRGGALAARSGRSMSARC